MAACRACCNCTEFPYLSRAVTDAYELLPDPVADTDSSNNKRRGSSVCAVAGTVGAIMVKIFLFCVMALSEVGGQSKESGKFNRRSQSKYLVEVVKCLNHLIHVSLHIGLSQDDVRQ